MAVTFEGLTFEKENYTVDSLPKGDYDGCKFVSCDFSGSTLSIVNFVECTFEDCNLSNVDVKSTTFNDVVFEASKCLGVDFSQCNDFLMSFHFKNCQLDYCNFQRLNLSKTKFDSCSLIETDFTDSVLKQASFCDSDLKRAVFHNSNLEKCDFRNVKNLIIDPNRNKLKKAIFDQNSVRALLSNLDIVVR